MKSRKTWGILLAGVAGAGCLLLAGCEENTVVDIASLPSLSQEEAAEQTLSRMEDTLESIDGVAEAAVQYTQGTQEAAVTLQMEEGQQLSEEARAAVQNLVASAWNLPAGNVQVAVQ